MRRQDKGGPKGPSDKNPFKGGGALDETAVKNPTDALTEQRQRKDTGPLSHERNVGQFSGRGRPPLQKK
jgi:hypothetical protein